MNVPVALLALACLAAEPAPLVGAEVLAVLRAGPVAAAPTRADVAAAIAAVTPLRRRRHAR
ncbi:hypothetical protein SAMN02799631_03237 [Methylobacterium sp. 174MFSha1.1]|uniref:hypothetical protein n=1 Tax=Methylobacterium sp. 174MFSha1.1 TaxID=1502749 RepID=UPI0008E14B25|nr:hypothetical protein [Methylobacterium sp. 174MFSha1.1]SFU93376.1 hypothetical protein SAMN02799631_03237 [Methylobacterium sp. 174MFSha1.1]